MLDVNQCRGRQRRLLPILQEKKLDAVVCAAPQHVYYFSAHWTSWLNHSALLLFADGRSWLCTANQKPSDVAADDVAAYEANWMGTQRQDQAAVVAEHVRKVLSSRHARQIGLDTSRVGCHVTMALGNGCQSIDQDLWQLRRKKDPDELQIMKKAIGCCEAMYRRAKEIIEPGIPELELYAQLNGVAITSAGQLLTAPLGNDYACGAMGGPPRKDHRAEAGQLYILDLGPAVQGYFSDNARTFSVDRRPTDQQMQAWEAVVECHRIVQKLARPGARCRDLFSAVDEFLKLKHGSGMPHHLGHGVGLEPHEFPHLNPRWDDVLMEGEVFTAEPGQYRPELGGGIRIENQYLVTSSGIENLVSSPMELV